MQSTHGIGSVLTVNARKVGEAKMNDPYKKAWESIEKALSIQSKMILWIAERTLSVKDYKDFIDEFAKKPEDNHDELLDFIRKEGR